MSPSRNHPVNHGTLCVKGWNCHEFVHHPARLKFPQIREGTGFRRASWDEALDRAAAGFARARGKGPQAFGVFSCSKASNEMNFAAQKFTRQVMGTNNIDSCNRT